MKLINLSQPLTEETPIYPGDPQTKIDYFSKLDKDGLNVSQAFLSTHLGTHIQTSLMVDDKGKKLSDYPIEAFSAKGVAIDLQNIGKDEEIRETVLGSVSTSLKDLAILFYTSYNSTENLQSEEYFHHTPTLSTRLVQELLENNTKIIGIDSHSICKEPYEQYKMFAGHDTLLVEGLVNLHQVDGVEFTFVCMPPMIETEAFPVAAYAIIEDK